MHFVANFLLLLCPFALFASTALAANVSCAVVTPHPLSEAEKAYLDGKYDTAATLYQQQLAQKPNDPELTAGLAEVLLQQTKLQEADDLLHKAVAQNPNSVVLQTSLGLVQYREGTPWLASDTAVQAMKIDPCYPQLRFLRARLLQLNSNFASGAREIAIAHTLDPHDPRIRLRWLESIPLNQRISELETYLSDATGDNPERLASLQKYLAYLKGEMPGPDSKTSERRTCHLVSNTNATSIPLQRLMWGGATVQTTAQLGSESNQQAPIRAYALDVKINDHNTRLEIDTGASGLLVSQSVADKAGLKKAFDQKVGGIGDQGSVAAYTAYADSIKIGELEFHDCEVEVVEKRNVAGSEGLIGMDVLSHFLLTLDFPMRKLVLGPLPPRPDDTSPAPPTLDTLHTAEPGEGTDSQTQDHAKSTAAPVALHDRYIAPEMKDWTPVYRAGHFLLIPTMLNDNRRRIFILDTGANHSSIDPAVASEFTKLRARDDIEIRGLSGKVKTAKVFTADDVVFKFGGISHENMDVMAFDSPGMSQYAGMQLAGLIGFSTLSQTTVKIDYRDALVHFSYDKNRGYVDQQNPY